MGHRFLGLTILLVFGMLICSSVGHTAPPEWAKATGNPWMQKVSGFITIPTTSSIPFAGESTPSGCLIFTSPSTPPEDYEAGELYLYVDDLRGWELK